MSKSIPEEIWSRWTQPEWDPLRQSVLVFGGSLKKEIALASFEDISLLYQEGEGTNTLKGVFYLTSKRMVFLPKNQIPHPSIAETTFDSIKTLSGVRSDLTMTITDTNGAVVNFQFPTTKSLFHCFNILRALSEASRKDESKFRQIILTLCMQKDRDETPFSSIEVELPECHQTLEVPEANLIEERERKSSVIDDAKFDILASSLAPLKFAFDYFNHLHFDIHIKLRILFFISGISFIMKFIPFLPLVCLVIVISILYHGWECIKNDGYIPESRYTTHNQSVIQLQSFFNDWFAWQNPKKSKLLLFICGTIFILWNILPRQAYVVTCAIGYILLIVHPLIHSNILTKIVQGFWFCT